MGVHHVVDRHNLVGDMQRRITAATLQEAHREVEESASIGKLVVVAS